MTSPQYPPSKAYIRLREQVQEIFNFSVIVSYAIPTLKKQISLIEKGHIPSLPPPDYYFSGRSTPSELRARALNYKRQLASYTLISIFSFFEAFVIDIIKEMIDYHGGQDELIRKTQEYQKRAFNITPQQEKIKRKLRGKDKRKIQRYQKHSKELIDSGYRFPSELFSSYGVKMLIQKINNFKAKDIPDLLTNGLHMNVPQTTIDEFHRIKDIRNDIAHGKPKKLSVKEVSMMNDTLRDLALLIDNHLNMHYFINQDHI